MPYADLEKRREAVRRSKQRPEYKARRRAIYAERYAHPRVPVPLEVKKTHKAECDRRYRKKHATAIKRQKADYYQKHKTDISRYYLIRRSANVQVSVAISLRNPLHVALRRGYRASSISDYLSCTLHEFRRYVASRFLPGMFWSNYGKWHLDHIKPVCAFDLTCEEQLKRAFHYTNFQPLWAEDNWRKNRYGNKRCQPAARAV